MTADRTTDIATEARRILLEKLIADPRLDLPESVIERAGHVRFVPENTHPFIPSLLKFSESSSALWALAGLFSDAIAQNRYGLPPQSVTLDVYSASMFLMSTYMFKAENGASIWDPFLRDRLTHLDLGNLHESYRRAATNMYKAKDGVFFHLHGSLNPTNTFTMLDLPQHRLDLQGPEHYNTVLDIFKDAVAQRDSRWLDIESNEHWRQAGTICYTPEQFRLTSHGKAMENEPIYNVNRIMEDIPPVAWPTVDARYRPLAGINVLDLSRVVAGPTISSILALLGANVLRISSHTLPDTIFLYDTQIGKRDTSLNLKTPEGKLKLKQLLEDADVIVDGYRPGALEKLGFSRTYVQEVGRRRGRGIVHLRECCYGWKGEWSFRSGWQQISDALTGTPWIQGKYFGLDEPVIPLLPNSDYQTGIIGAISVCQALLQRATVGGSYNVDVSLTQFNLWYLGLGIHDDQTHHELLRMNPGFSARHDTELHPLVAKVEMLSRRSQGEGKGKIGRLEADCAAREGGPRSSHGIGV
ncbi:CoA-transferase family III [Corynespora cassiicola Philippines]|uniref:CoA-transferase family III n=1 Tax=Corynespora cassiicola Philippines TaxID=1448308 RepID=A0A2T2N4S5_CORCC|nr:CoA-transferase family III [Corynespora cassiicola Philippines]